MKIAQQALMSHDQWRECVQKCCGVIEHGIAIGSLEMCGRGACSLGLRARLGRRADPDGVLVCGAFSNVIGALSHPHLKSFRIWTRLGAWVVILCE